MVPAWLIAGFYFVAFEFVFWYSYHYWVKDEAMQHLFYFGSIPFAILLFGLFIRYVGIYIHSLVVQSIEVKNETDIYN